MLVWYASRFYARSKKALEDRIMELPQWNAKFTKEFAAQQRADQRREKKIKSVIRNILIVLVIGGVIWLII